jgi:hypothetical protein
MNDWLGNPLNKGQRQYNINDDFFKKWSNNMAYILGFWWADGNIHISNGSYRFSIAQKDRYILESILEEMNCNPKPIRIIGKSKNHCYNFSIYSKAIVTDIMSLGGTENKSLTTKFPLIPPQYLSDFIRGYFDGDGCIYFCSHLQAYKSKFTSGSKDFIYKLHEHLTGSIPHLNGSIEEAFPKTYPSSFKKEAITRRHVCYNLSFTPSDTLRLLHYLYASPSVLKLDKKYKLFCKSKETNKIIIKERYSYKEIKDLIKNKNIKNLLELQEYRLREKDYKIPITMSYYGRQYKGANVLFDKFMFIPYKDAQTYISKLKFKNVRDFIKWTKTDSRPPNINTNPQKYYKNHGWTNWYDFLGKI